MDSEEELEGMGYANADEEAQWEKRARKRLSMDSMPGSLSGSQADFEDFDEDEDEDEDEQGEEEGAFGTIGSHRDASGHDDPEEAAEEGFDDDLLATGEMESVPFL